jgi:hypothetical protein
MMIQLTGAEFLFHLLPDVVASMLQLPSSGDWKDRVKRITGS